ncbi:MAG: replication-relaxation family protein [Rhizomicrobium sp.]
MGQVRASHPRFKRDGIAPRIELTEDDIAILRAVHRHRFVRADDLYRLFGERSQDKLSRRLTRLYRNKFLDRPIAQVDRFREGGSRPLVYGLDAVGARYLKETLGVPIGSTDWKARNRSYTRESLDHTLAISPLPHRFGACVSGAARRLADPVRENS